MKIALIGDCHLGFAFGTEKEEDSFRQFNEALDKAISEKVDLILLPGDIFDVRIPRQEVWGRVMEIFQKPIHAQPSGVKLITYTNGEMPSEKALGGIPVVAIHGTHERRGDGFVNPVHIIAKGGFVVYLDKGTAVFEKNGEKVAIHGFSGVPEEFVADQLKKWNVKPVEGAKNLFMFHQSLKEYIYDPDSTFIGIDDLPKGMDWYINGHIHWANFAPEKKFVIPGSTVITQQRRTEAEKKKGFYIFETKDFKFQWHELKTQRPFYYEELTFDKAHPQEVLEKSRAAIQRIMSKKHELKPMIKLKIRGKLETGKNVSNLNLDEISKGLDAIISIDREIETDDLKKKIELLREQHGQKKSVEELGMDMVMRMLAETKYSGVNPSEIIDSLSEGEMDVVVKKVIENFRKSRA